MDGRLSAALLAALLGSSAGCAGSGQTVTAAPPGPPSGAVTAPVGMTPAGTQSIDARALRAQRTATGFTLTGEAEVGDACRAARFDISPGNVSPPQFDLTQYTPADKSGLACATVLTWTAAQPLDVAAAAGQTTVTVHTQTQTYVVPIT